MANTQAGEVEDGVHVFHEAPHAALVPDVGEGELAPCFREARKVLAAAIDQIIDNDDVVSAFNQLADELGADEAGAACD